MAVSEVNYFESGGGSITATITDTSSSITGTLSGDNSNAVAISGSITFTAQVAQNGYLFTVTPVPTRETTISKGLNYNNSSATRDVKIGTDGKVYNAGGAIQSGNTWAVDFSYVASV